MAVETQVAIRELDLSACHANTLSDKINAVPGLKTSTAFFTFLRANLVLDHSALSSCANTPTMEPTSPSFAPTNNTSASASWPSSGRVLSSASSTTSSSPQLSRTGTLTPLDDIPPLSLEPLETPADRSEGMRLVAESVAEMRGRAARAVATHPLCLAGLGLAVAAVYRAAAESSGPRLGALLGCGLIASYVFAARHLAAGYLYLADQFDPADWLRDPPFTSSTSSTSSSSVSMAANGGTGGDILLGARRPGDKTLVGALVLRLQPSPAVAGPSRGAATGGHARRRSKGGAASLRGGRGIIRAWTTRLGFRRQGAGAELLESAVRLTKDKCGRDADVGFAKEHANSTMLLPAMFNAGFRRAEVRAAKALDAAVAQWDMSRKKR